MIDIKISQEIKDKCPNIRLGVIKATVQVNDSCDSLLNEIDNYCDLLKNNLKLEDLTTDLRIKE